MAFRNVSVNILESVTRVVGPPTAKKSRPKRLLRLSGTGNIPEIKDEDLQRFKRQYGLWF
jgi:hypothetical protein